MLLVEEEAGFLRQLWRAEFALFPSKRILRDLILLQ